MAKKLRKMLGDVNAPEAVALMRLIDTQSKTTICNWCIDYAEQHILPIFEKNCPNDERPRNALNAARELDGNPVAQAAARACGQGSAVVHTLSHSIGLYFYGSAAVAYDRLGLCATDDEYGAIAEEVCIDLTAALQAVAVSNEPNPAKIKWNC